jgi:hypothetical protein
MTHEIYKFKKGQRVNLDDIYPIMGLLPEGSFHQDDISEDGGDAGESLLFLENVTVKVSVRVT